VTSAGIRRLDRPQPHPAGTSIHARISDAFPPREGRHPPIVPAAFRKLDTVAVLTARLLPAPVARKS
jgi:hypothetical protein